MKIESIDEFLSRGGKIKKVCFTKKSYEIKKLYNGKFKDYTKKESTRKTKEIISRMEQIK